MRHVVRHKVFGWLLTVAAILVVIALLSVAYSKLIDGAFSNL